MIALKPLLLTFNLLCAGDAITTHIILDHGGRELIFPTQNPWAVDTMVAGQAAATSLIFSWADKKHPKATRIALTALIAVRAGAVVHNAIVAQGMLR